MSARRKGVPLVPPGRQKRLLDAKPEQDTLVNYPDFFWAHWHFYFYFVFIFFPLLVGHFYIFFLSHEIFFKIFRFLSPEKNKMKNKKCKKSG